MSAPICKCCEALGGSTQRLETLLQRTEAKKLPVLVCDHCDGPVLKLASRANHTFFDPDNIEPPETV